MIVVDGPLLVGDKVTAQVRYRVDAYQDEGDTSGEKPKPKKRRTRKKRKK